MAGDIRRYRFADGVLTASEYDVSKKKFTVAGDTYNANQFWKTLVDVDGTSNDVHATGEDLKDVLEAYNQNHLTTDGVAIAWDGNPEALNGPDSFWQVAKDAGWI